MSPILKIRLYGDPCLRQKCAKVEKITVSERLLIESMLQTMYEEKGIGLAAPQVGINKQIFVADAGEGPIAVINPRIIKSSGSEVSEEGCLSIPGVMINVDRPKKIKVQYTNEAGDIVEAEFTEMWARVFQHENDHLNGKLIIDYASEKEKKEIEPKLTAIQKET